MALEFRAALAAPVSELLVDGIAVACPHLELRIVSRREFAPCFEALPMAAGTASGSSGSCRPRATIDDPHCGMAHLVQERTPQLVGVTGRGIWVRIGM